MPLLLCYTKQGADHYRDVNDAMHLALSYDGTAFQPLRNNTAVLFPKADLMDGSLCGCSKTLLYPWLFRFADGAGGVMAVRRNKENKPDTQNLGSVIIYRTTDFVHYELHGFLPLEETEEVITPRCMYDAEKQVYLIEWQTRQGIKNGKSPDLKKLEEVSQGDFSMLPADSFGIPHASPGNCLELSKTEADYISEMLAPVYHCRVDLPKLTLPTGETWQENFLPKATCVYSDGSTHDKNVKWDRAALGQVDTKRPGVYRVSGEIQLKEYPLPFIMHASDPCVFHYRGKYYFTSSDKEVALRESNTIDDLPQAERTILYKDSNPKSNFWAQELHLVNDVPFIFTALCPGGDWTGVQSVLFRCRGEIGNPNDWEGPVYVVKKDGSRLMETGISLDMTYFTLDGLHYVSWSNREMNPIRDTRNERGTNGTADIYIATVDPAQPWQLTSDPICISRADYGWSRLEVDVEEGPYLLRHGDDLFLSISGAGCSVVYTLGLLHAKYGSDLLDPASWCKVPYPLLTQESVPGQYGPGHNNFFKDPQNGEDDWIALHYRPLAEGVEALYDANRYNPRVAAIRRVHWNKNGYPNLEMFPERDLNPGLKNVELEIIVE